MAIHHLVVSALMALSYLQTQLHTSKQYLNSTEWLLYKRQFGKSYASEEVDSMRKLIFFANKHKIDKHNAEHEHMKLGLNHLSDQSDAEFKQLLGYRPQEQLQDVQHERKKMFNKILAPSPGPPDELDWRKVPNRVSEVGDQGKCGSSWAFSAVGALEGQEVPQMNVKNLTPLSVQNLVDCTYKGRDGCKGGWMNDAFNYVKNGIEGAGQYPYVGVGGSCKFNKSRAFMNDSGIIYILGWDDEDLQGAVSFFGPVSTAVDASLDSFKNYKSGVYYDPKCASNFSKLSQAVLVVGYGHDKKLNLDYWIVKNSWGKKWGEDGYIRMIRNHNNHCGIATYPSVPYFENDPSVPNLATRPQIED